MFDLFAGIIVFVISSALACFLKTKIENALAIGVMLIITVIYAMGFFNHMEYGKYIVFAFFIISVIYIITDIKKMKGYIFTIGGIYYWISLALGIIRNRYKVINTWDELAQWALTVKYSYTTNCFGAQSGSNCYYADYPPASACFHYFWMNIGNGFDDRRLYVSMSVLITVLLIPILSKLDLKKNIVRNIMVSIALYLSVLTFYRKAYSSLTVDCLLGLCFAYILYMEFFEENNKVKILGVSLMLFVISIIKSSGIIFAIISIIIIISREKLNKWKYVAQCILNIVIAKISWNTYLSIQCTNNTWNFKTRIENFKFDNLAEWQRQGFANFYKAIFNYKTIENTSQTVFYINFLKIPCIIWIVIFGTCIFCLWKKNKSTLGPNIILMIGLCLYIIMTSFLYFSFGEGEVSILSSFSRYLGTYFIAIYLFFMYSFVIYIVNDKISYLILLILVIFPHTQFDGSVLESILPRYSNIMKSKYDEHRKAADEIIKINKYLPEKSIIYLFNGDIAGTNYELTPTYVASPLWASGDFGYFSELSEQLGCEYVYFDDTYGTIETDEFASEYGYIFYDDNLIMDRAIYEIIYDEEGPRLQFMTQIQ